MSYCKSLHSFSPAAKPYHQYYHDHQYGFPLHDDNELFGRLLLEINQAGLSWETILKKQDSIRKAYSDFNILEVSHYQDADFARLMGDAGVIRNRLKINAAIENAKVILRLQEEFGSFESWIEFHHPRALADWVKLFKKTFKFTGGEIVNEFLMSIGVLPHAHEEDCPIYKKILKLAPLWKQGKASR